MAGAAGSSGAPTGTAGAAATGGEVTGGAPAMAGAGGAPPTSATAGAAGPATTGIAGAAVAPTGAAGAAGTATGVAGSAASAGAAGAAGKTTVTTTGMAGSPSVMGAAGTGGTATPPTPSGATIVPLYTDPEHSSWAALIAAKKAHPTVGIIAVVNPNSGPDSAVRATYTAGIAKLIAANIRVLGYVGTDYTARTPATVKADVDRWKMFYPGLHGIFFDEQSNKAEDVAYYKDLSQYAKSQGLSYTVGNPGADTAEAFVGALDMMLIYESDGIPALSRLQGWHTKHAPSNFGIIPYATALDAAFVREARKHVGYIYLQNDDLPNPWDSLPSYFDDLLEALE